MITQKRRDMPSVCFQGIEALVITLKACSCVMASSILAICGHANGKNTNLIHLKSN